MKFAVLRSVVLGGLLALARGAGGSEPTAEQTCRFLRQSGANLPWIHYGWDLGANPWGGAADGFSSNRAALASAFAALRGNRATLCRVFLFGDCRSGLLYDGFGGVSGAEPLAYTDMDAIVAEARTAGVRLLPVLLDFMVADGVATNQDGVLLGEHPELIADPRRKRQFIENVVRPFVRRYGTNEAIYAWDILNEPSFASAVTTNDLKQFVEDCAAAILSENPGARVTFGNYDRYDLEAYGAATCTAAQVHYYDFAMSCYWDFDAPATNILASKPVLFGEVEATNAADKLQAALTNGYEGVLFWSVRAPFNGSDFGTVADAYHRWAAVALADACRMLSITSVRLSDSQVRLDIWPTFEGLRYRVERSAAPGPGAWQSVGEFGGAAGTNRASVLVSIPAGEGVFYRVRADL